LFSPYCGTTCGSLFFIDTTSTVIYTLSLRDALPIYRAGVHHLLHRDDGRLPRRRAGGRPPGAGRGEVGGARRGPARPPPAAPVRSEEHTSELQSRENLVCRLWLEKKKKIQLIL